MTNTAIVPLAAIAEKNIHTE